MLAPWGLYTNKRELQLAHGAELSCLWLKALWFLGKARKLVRQDLMCMAGRGRWGNCVGSGHSAETAHSITWQLNEDRTESSDTETERQKHFPQKSVV